jgi:hypothetical protein
MLPIYEAAWEIHVFLTRKKIYRNAPALDLSYIRSWLKEFSSLLETDEVLHRFEKPLQTWRARSSQ